MYHDIPILDAVAQGWSNPLIYITRQSMNRSETNQEAHPPWSTPHHSTVNLKPLPYHHKLNAHNHRTWRTRKTPALSPHVQCAPHHLTVNSASWKKCIFAQPYLGLHQRRMDKEGREEVEEVEGDWAEWGGGTVHCSNTREQSKAEEVSACSLLRAQRDQTLMG